MTTDNKLKDIETQAQKLLQNPQGASSEAIYECIETCIEKAQELEKRMTLEAAKANDPTLTSSDDGRAARRESEDARLDAARMRNLEGHLRDLLVTVLDREQRDKWNSDHGRVGVVVEQADQRFNKLPALLQEFVSILADCNHADALSSELGMRAPSGKPKKFELFRDRCRALFDKTVLVDFSGQQLYPSRTTIDVDRICPPVPHRRAWTSEWWREDHERRQQQVEREKEEVAAAAVARDQFYAKRP